MIKLSSHRYRAKQDVIDWSHLEGEAVGDLNYRLPREYANGRIAATLTWLCGVSLLSGLFILAMRFVIAAFFASPTTASTFIVAGGLAATAVLAGVYHPWPNHRLLGNRFTASAATFLMAILFWGLVFVAFRGNLGEFPAFFQLVVVLPLLIYSADRVTTHYVHWLSANPKLSPVDMKQWRQQWNLRLKDFASPRVWLDLPIEGESCSALVEARRNYFQGVLGVAGALIVPVLMLAIRGELPPTTTVVCQLFALMAVALGRCWMSRPESMGAFFRAVQHFGGYARNRRLTPWIFQSPCGSQFRRQLILALTLVMLAICLTPMLADSYVPMADAPNDDSRAVFSHRWNAIWQNVQPGITNIAHGDFADASRIASLVVAMAIVPTGFFLLATFAIAAPTLARLRTELRGPASYQLDAAWSEFDGYVERLQQSAQPSERDSLLLGYGAYDGFPVLLDRALLHEHMLITGATGSGKTSLGLIPLTTQLIRRSPNTVIVLDCKGDDMYFDTCRREAQAAGRTFKWFTNRPQRSTFVFNPFAQRHLRQLSLPEIVGFFINMLNLYHGDDYGRAWFSISARTLFQRTFKEYQQPTAGHPQPLHSFADLADRIKHETNSWEWASARHLAFILESLSEFEQLNFSPRFRAPKVEPLHHAIQFSEAISDNQVIYFSLVGAIDLASVGLIAKMALYSTLTAADAHKQEHGIAPDVYVICDEAQTVAAKNLENVLAQARSYGVACILAHQTMSQFNPPGGVDLREMVQSCTAVKQYFDIRDPATRKLVAEISGQVGYYRSTWYQTDDAISQGNIGEQFAIGLSSQPLHQVTSEVGPRLEAEDIADAGRMAGHSILRIERNQGLSQYLGAFPIAMNWLTTKEEYDRRQREFRWPPEDERTITASTQSVIPSEPAYVPPLTEDTAGRSPQEDLNEFHRRLKGEE